MIPANLVGYCGLYCGACGIYQGRIKQAVDNLRKIISAYGFDKMAPDLAKWEPSFKHYPEFEKVLDGFVKLLGSCPGCIAGGGDPTCAVRECCRQKAFSTCADCAEIGACEKLQRSPYSLDTLRRIRDLGVEKWAQEMQKKVDAGYSQLDEPIG